MNTKYVMSGAAIVLGLAGIVCLFLPEEIFKLYNSSAENVQLLLVQLLGAAYLGFASLNWISRNALMGGIYGRPVVGANYTHFIIGSLLVVKAVVSKPDNIMLWCAMAVYALFAIGFAAILHGPPPEKNK